MSEPLWSPALLATRAWTRVVLAICIGISLATAVQPGGGWLWSLCTSPDLVLSHASHWYTILTSPFAHASWLHLFFNMMAWVQLGNTFETAVGTAQFAFLFWVAVVLIGVLMAATSHALRVLLMTSSYGAHCHLGLSGVLFCLLVLDLRASPATAQRSVLGIFNVSASWYPIILLVVLQILVPHVSFVGHLSGLLVGYILLFAFDSLRLPARIVQSVDRVGEAALGSLKYARSAAGTPLPLHAPGVVPPPTGFLKPVLSTGTRSMILTEQTTSSSSGTGKLFPGQGTVLGGGSAATPPPLASLDSKLQLPAPESPN